jgi:hypothetical protein
MLATIQLNDEPFLRTKKIDHVIADRGLPAELEAAEPAIAQELLQLGLGIGRIATKRSREAVRCPDGMTPA